MSRSWSVARVSLAFGLVSWLSTSTVCAAEVVKETFGSGGKTRTYYLLIQDNVKEKAPVPLIVLLHGSGRNGKTQTDQWESLAKKEGFIIVAPDALTPEAWRIPEDGPDFLYDLVELLQAQHEEIDRRRVYLFGHSAGAIHSLVMGLLESEYFAGVAVHAGALAPGNYPAMDTAARKIPMAIWVGTNDALFPLAAVRATRDALNSRGFNTQLTEIRNHTHNYYSRSGEINKGVWEFLQKIRLDADPNYQRYAMPR